MRDAAQVDAYIAAAADFARPILVHIRALVHAAQPQACEAIKWGKPHFVYRTRNLASMAAFRGHAAISLYFSDHGRPSAGMGNFGRITRLADLPPDDDLRAMLAKGAAMIDAGDISPRMRRQPRAPLPVHPALTAAIDADARAAAIWAAFPPGKIRDYAEWIAEAKTHATRDRRIAQAVEWIAHGKGRNWQYEKG